MKNKDNLIYASIGVLAVAVFVLIYFFLPRNISWNITYSIKDENPYGLYHFYSTIKEGTPQEKFVLIDHSLEEQLNTSDSGSVYFLIGTRPYYEYSDFVLLDKYLRNGNDVFISSEDFFKYNFLTFLHNFEMEFGDELCLSSFYEMNVPVKTSVDDTVTDFSLYIFRNRKQLLHKWVYFTTCYEHQLKTDSIRVVSTMMDGKANAIAIRHGKGTLYLHTSTLAFSNYFFIKNEGFNYAGHCFEPFAGKKIYWDEASKNRRPNGGPPKESPDVLKYIRSQKELNWAMHLLLAGVLLFVIFRGKRVQRIIPVFAAPQNKSADFVKMVAALYFKQNNHNGITDEMMTRFYQFVNNKYGIKIQDGQNNENLARLAKISETDPGVLKEIADLAEELKLNGANNNKKLLKLDNLLDHFYKNCR